MTKTQEAVRRLFRVDPLRDRLGNQPPLPAALVLVRPAPQDGRWFWTAAKECSLGSGFATSARQAAVLAERPYL